MRILRTEKKTDTEVLVATAVTMSLMKFIKKRQMKLMGYINRGGGIETLALYAKI